MEKSNETEVFGQKKQRTERKYQAGKVAGIAAAGVAAVGMAASAFAADDAEPVMPEPEPVVPTDTEPTSAPNHRQDTGGHQEPEPEPEHPSDPLPEPEVPIAADPQPEPEPEPQPEPEPVMPVVEIDPNDNDLDDVIEDVTTVEVVYDINGNPMLVATAHNSVDGEFYLVDVDMDGDFDVILNDAGVPVADLTGENDQLITLTDVESKMTDEYIARNEIDDMIAQNNMIGEQLQNDITIVDDCKA